MADVKAGDDAALETLRNIGDQFAESRAVSIAVLAPDSSAAAMQAPFQSAAELQPGLFHVLKNGSVQAEQLRKNLPFLVGPMWPSPIPRSSFGRSMI